MKTEIDVKTTVIVDLGQIPLHDLIDEIEDRGHRVDETDLENASVHELLDELSRRDYKRFTELDFRQFIKALEQAGCPSEIIAQLQEWDRQPMVTYQKLQGWKALCLIN